MCSESEFSTQHSVKIQNLIHGLSRHSSHFNCIETIHTKFKMKFVDEILCQNFSKKKKNKTPYFLKFIQISVFLIKLKELTPK